MSGDDEQGSSSASASASASAIASLNNQLENIKVAVRIRPFTEREKQRNNRRIVDIQQNTVFLHNTNYNDAGVKKFTFDYSYWSHDGFKKDPSGVNVPDPYHPNYEKYVGQEKVFEDLGCFLLNNALRGYNSALLAYGPTGSGKSYTVSGYGQNEGILPRFARALFFELDSSIHSSNHVEEGETASNREKTPSKEDNLNKAEGTEEETIKPINKYEVFFSMLEIYNEVVRDLLAKNGGDVLNQSSTSRRGLKVREHPKHGFFVENLTSYPCADKNEIERRIEEGLLNKSIAATSMNETSSRGHTIYEFRIKQYKFQANQEEILTTSMVQLVDLAGSERMSVHAITQVGGDSSRSSSPYPTVTTDKTSRTQNTRATSSTTNGSSTPQQSTSLMRRAVQTNTAINSNYQKRFKESISINQSLSALGNCIQVMSQYSQQVENNSQSKRPPPKIPYRDSVLTKLLNRCSLSGNSKVVIIATLSPVEANYEDTLSTLRFADRAKRIRTHVIINQTIKSEMFDSLQKENERLKQLVGRRTAKSDDSSQTSNFDESENIVENFTDSSASGRGTNIDVVATPRRSRTTVRRSRDSGQVVARSKSKIPKGGSANATYSSNPSLVVKEQMKRLVSPASKKLANIDQKDTKPIHKSRSMGAGLSNKLFNEGEDKDSNYCEENLDDEATDDELEGELVDIKEGLISPESEDSYSALADEDLTDEEKIVIFNKLLSNSTVKSSTVEDDEESSARSRRPKKANRNRAEIKQVSTLSSTLKKSNPYLSNLNPDEQLTGMISYIIKRGETVIGKGNNCDIVLHGLELRTEHAKIIRIESVEEKQDTIENGVGSSLRVYIEPIMSAEKDANIKDVALMVNGAPVKERIPLNHCDRLLFGTSAYFVYSNADDFKTDLDGTVANLDMVTFDMAKNEVIKKILTEEKNEDIIKEINDYTHRPSTGKHKMKSGEFKERGNNTLSRGSFSKLKRSMTINDPDSSNEAAESIQDKDLSSAQEGLSSVNRIIADHKDNLNSEATEQEASYREQLMNDTYEFAMPVAEVNAVAKEMGIRVTYELKILTAEEQLSDRMISGYADSSISDGFNTSSTADSETDRTRIRSADHTLVDDRVSNIIRLDHLDIPPALFVKVHEDEFDTDFYWSKEKFAYRRCKILELYGSWDVGGKSGLVEYLIDQSRVQNGYLIDPFIDDPLATFVLIGHAQITLESIVHRGVVRQSFDIFDMSDATVGTIDIEAIPCHPTLQHGESQDYYDVYSDEDLKKEQGYDPNKILGEKLVFMLKINSCRDLPQKYTNIFCQYALTPGSSGVKTRTFGEGSLDLDQMGDNYEELIFDHSHYICFERVNQDVLDFLEHGFLTVQIVGQYKLSETMNRSPTVVSTIINSINKYRSKLEQQQAYNNMNYPSSVYYNSNTNSTKSARGPSSGAMHSNSGASSTVSTSATVNLFDQQNEDDEGSSSVNGLSQENIIDMILTKRKLDRAENQLHYLKRTVNIAEHYNKKHIPVKTVKKLLTSYGHELDTGSLDEMATETTTKGKTSKNSTCSIQ